MAYTHRDNYLSLSAGAPRRLAMLKVSASSNKWVRPMTWRDVRFMSFASDTGLSQGFNGTGKAEESVWTTHNPHAALQRETFCDEVEGVRIAHKGWFTDTENSETARGIVSALPHGKFIAGYLWNCNDERVYFSEIFDSARDAAHMADEHARVFGEDEMEHSQRFQAAQYIESEIETALYRLRECVALRNKSCMQYVRDEISDLVSTIRASRETLRTDYAGVL